MIALVNIRKVIFSFLLLFIAQNVHSQTSDLSVIKYKGRNYFMNGMNIAWNKFGGDFGRHEVWGGMYDPEAFEEIFQNCEDYGVNVVRLWIHCDGRSNPEFNSKGYCMGFDTDFFINLDDCFRIAKNHNVMIMPCLWSFDMCKDFTESAGSAAGGHDDLLTDTTKMNSYINRAVIPLIKRYKDQCNLIAWEVCNEPEWALDREAYGLLSTSEDSSWTYRTAVVVPVESMQLLTAKVAAAVHTYTDKMVTTGSAAIRWNSDSIPGRVNLWSDHKLQEQFNSDKAYLDFYQVHYYDYMNPRKSDPFDTARSVSDWGWDRPAIIGECPASAERSKLYPPDSMIARAILNQYAGIMFWSYNGDDGVGGWDDFKDALKRSYEINKEFMHMDNCPCRDLPLEEIDLTLGRRVRHKMWLNWNDADPILSSAYVVLGSKDGENFNVIKKVSRIREKNSVKIKARYSHFKIVHRDVYGYERTSPAFGPDGLPKN